MKKIGMIVAVEMSAVLKRYGTAAEVELSHGFEIHSYQAENYMLYVVNAGVGEIAAAAATQELISRYGVELVVNFGVVGGLTEEMAQTKTCIIEKLVHYDFDLAEIDSVPVGQYPGYDSIYIPTTPELVDKAVELVPELKRVTCASADKFIGTTEKKRSLHERFGADICEMEAAGIVLTCNRNGVPVLSIKTVSDGISGGAEDFYAEVLNSSLICLDITDRIIKEL